MLNLTVDSFFSFTKIVDVTFLKNPFQDPLSKMRPHLNLNQKKFCLKIRLHLNDSEGFLSKQKVRFFIKHVCERHSFA